MFLELPLCTFSFNKVRVFKDKFTKFKAVLESGQRLYILNKPQVMQFP